MRMMLIRCLLATLATPALAQQQPSPIEQRISAMIGAMVIQSARDSVQIEQLQAALATAQTRVKELEDKYEPKGSK